MRSLILSAGLLALAGSAQARDAAECEALHNTALQGGFVSSARVVEASESLPAYCEVRATALPAISIEVRLPMENWNGKYYQAGCGGFCGILGRADAAAGWVNAMKPGLERGYATATSDSGHHALSVVDAGWADANPHAERDWGWRSIGETHRVAQAMIERFYGGGSEQAIFQGCSTGGRMAHVAALRYPDMFDGIISGAPAMDYPGLVATASSWLVQSNTDADGNTILKPGKDKLIGDAVMAQCDGLDGAEDGLISDPRQCPADLAALQCDGTQAEDTCLTPDELGVIAKWRQGPVNKAGEQLYPGGIPAGSEPFWWLWLTGKDENSGGLIPAFATGFGRYMAFDDDPGENWTPLDFDFDRDPDRMSFAYANYNGDNPDISAFREAGGKMIVWHGWADAIVPPLKTVDWYEKAAETAGGEDALKEDVALFMIPGLDHCGLLPGPGGVSQNSLDPMTPLEAWLNDGVRPESIAVSQ
ncbi:tannase/feruloyl esterase family alpha/beta hydrolase [Sedimentitalea sp. JM2-8]|uniref:Tannase/feruloyl esterase family alpha/beta hydrolase n=1 Tax=Sedimentitalea xiamensis TaxID=3050037 RepID=A0ABT7F8V0_9RHOB|nr:tannase/feruloyl esterase family alpha/beta hydrolase [Sedimentitalea xiamensis]MDK3071533.1 tannase/feruloyl esterase family alpha/beta hydrolase [Sedimentitalea xiamensis]